MKLIHTLAFLAVIGLCSVSHATVRTFTIDAGGTTGGRSVGPVGTTFQFSYDPGFANLSSNIAMTHSSFPGETFSLDNLFQQNLNQFYMQFLGNSSTKLNMILDFAAPAGSDLPDGTDVFTQINQNPYSSSTVISNATVTIASVPEPSAFGFGILAITLAGAGRWVRQRFFVS